MCELPFPATGEARSCARAAAVETEVIDLFQQFHSPLLRYAGSIGLSVHDAEEVIQEVFLALFRHLQLGRSRSNLRGWIFRVAHNLALKQRLANAKTQQHCFPEEAVDAMPNPEEVALFSQRQQRMQAVLRALPDQDRCCLNLRAEGLRYREIAAALGISLGAVSIALSRSFARLVRADHE